MSSDLIVITDYTQIFHTVPYINADIHRDSTGKKNDLTTKGPTWTEYATERNTDNTPVLGAIAVEDFIGIDIDNNPLFDELIQLAPDCTYIAISQPVSVNKGGHMLFSYDQTTVNTLKQISSSLKKMKIDVQIGKKLIYLATPANKTKHLYTKPLTKLSDLTPLPQQLLAALALKSLPLLLTQHPSSHYTTAEYPETSYGYMLESTLKPSIVQELTPKKMFPNITDMNDIPQGNATEWMLQVRKKLQVDSTVSPDVFRKTITYLNGLWDAPRGPSKQLTLDIERDIKSLDFKYTEGWQSTGFIFPNKLEHVIEVFYDDSKSMFIAHNRYTAECLRFDTQTTLANSIVSTHKQKKKYSGEQILKLAQTIRVADTPELQPLLSRHSTNSWPNFNLYKPSEGAKILQGIDTPLNIVHPTNILSFLENLIPDVDNRNRLKRFIAYKHTTYEHSPLYFVLAGVGGAGKGVLVNTILKYFSGSTRLHQADLMGITNNFNSWMATTDWLEIEEAGEGYSSKENAKLVGTLKKLTGNPHLTIENKGKDVGTSQRHYMTPIISTNMQTKLITDTIANDRRLVLLKCPNKLEKITEDTRQFIQAMISELPSFAYYLRNLNKISHTDYHDNKAWKTDDYESYIEDTTSFTDKLFEAAEARDLKRFVSWLHELNIPYATIDSLFSTSITGKEARVLLYNTTGTSSIGAISLQELAENNVMLDTNMKNRFKSMKSRRSYDNAGKKYTIQVIEFDDAYHRLTENIEDISENLISF